MGFAELGSGRAEAMIYEDTGGSPSGPGGEKKPRFSVIFELLSLYVHVYVCLYTSQFVSWTR